MARVTVACSPDADDLFMMRALLEGDIDTGAWDFVIETAPTDALNQLALQDGPDVVAISIAHYPHIATRYQLLPHGGSMGEGYGPIVVAPTPRTLSELRGKRIAVPGLTTTAWLVLRMMTDAQPIVTPITPYARIFEAMRRGEVDAGLLIHEGRLTFEEEGFHEVVDLGAWWAEHQDGLPLPLGGNVIRRSLGLPAITEISSLLRQSIAHALSDRDTAIRWLMNRGSALRTPGQVSHYLEMYANQRTLDYGPKGREGIRRLLAHGAAAGHLPTADIDFAP